MNFDLFIVKWHGSITIKAQVVYLKGCYPGKQIAIIESDCCEEILLHDSADMKVSKWIRRGFTNP